MSQTFNGNKTQQQNQSLTHNGNQQLTQKALFDYKKTLVEGKNSNVTVEQRLNGENPELDETRSIKSEFDYSTKKKFVEMISQQQRQQKFKLPGTAEGERREDDKASVYSKRSGLSVRSGRVGLAQRLLEQGKNFNASLDVDAIAEQTNEGNEHGNDLTQQPCSECRIPLSEDELTINQRFIDQLLQDAVANSIELTNAVYPLCVKCHFE